MDDFIEILALHGGSHYSGSSKNSNPLPGILGLLGIAGYVIYKKIKKISQANMADLTLSVDLDGATAQPGQVLEATVELIPKKDFQIQRAMVQLVRVETYVDKRNTRHGTSYHKKTVDESVAEEVLWQEHNVRMMESIMTAVKLLVPQDALPTMQGKTVRGITPGVSWTLKSQFDIPSKFDLEEEQEIIVHQPLEIEALPHRPVVAEAKHSICTITMSIHTADVYKGNNFEGILRAEIHRETTISGVVIKLEGTEKFGDISTSLDIDKVVLNTDTMLQPGRIYDWPFQLDTSKAEVPSLQLSRSKVEYSITAKLDIAMRRDPPISQDVKIFI